MLEVATAISWIVVGYLAIGLFYAFWFVTQTIKSEPVAGRLTRFLFIPGAMLLWPVLLFGRIRQ